MEEINIAGVGAYVPPLIITNNDISKIVDTSDEWVSTRTGIKERRISEGEETSDIAIKAAKLALERANVKGEDIDLIIVATVTPDGFTPSVSCLVQRGICAIKASAFDINAACAGFVYGLEIAFSMMNGNKKYRNALVIGAETLSKITNWEDRSTCVLFGDGGGAVVLKKEEISTKPKYRSFHTKAVGKLADTIHIDAIKVKNPYVKESKDKIQTLRMDGKEVLKFATFSMVDGIKRVLKDCNLTLDDIDYIVPHQANKRIIEYTAKKFKIDMNKFYLNLDRYGNTSSASIPIALNEMYEKGILKNGIKIIMVGFGGGMIYGASLIEL
ncbi:MAG: ketoacyl-ACP synthase III [Clostridiales bacterium]|nr:ketoacyl-ACP synthase III [Clostridiales bacterium]